MSKEEDKKDINIKKKKTTVTGTDSKKSNSKNSSKKDEAVSTKNVSKNSKDSTVKETVKDSTKGKKVKLNKVDSKDNVESLQNSSKKQDDEFRSKNLIVYHGVGRRKSSVSRAYLVQGTGKIEINGIDYDKYFKNSLVYYKLLQPLNLLLSKNNYNLKINVFGGGFCGQVEAIRLSIAICLSKVKLENRSKLKEFGYLTTDSRVVERKKFGHKKARRSFQFTKR